MTALQQLTKEYGTVDCRDLGSRQLEKLRDGLEQVTKDEINSIQDGKCFVDLLRKFREAVAENDKLHGENYPQLLNSLLSVGEDGVYSNSLRFIFELIQNVDDCDYADPADCKLDMRFDFNKDEIVLIYNEVGFTPYNVFAITGIAEAAKNVSSSKTEIGEKGIGFKSVFGVAKRVFIRSGWFAFELYKDNFTIPVAKYSSAEYCQGTQMILYVPGRAQTIYKQIKEHYCRKEALFAQNPLLFLNKLTSLKLYFDSWRSMEFKVSRADVPETNEIYREDNVKISVNLHDYDGGFGSETVEEITCARYIYPIIYSRSACQSRYGEKTKVGSDGGKRMLLQAVVPCLEDVKKVGNGGLYSFLPTQVAFTVPVVCHAPFKLDASREFVDPQDNDDLIGNLWFRDTSSNLAILMDHVFKDWAQTVKQSIVFYLPSYNGNLFAKNNGKEKCLSSQHPFKGSHYLNLPLFLSAAGEYKNASDIFCFDTVENISDPIKVAGWMGISKELFLPPENEAVGRLGISIEKDTYHHLFRKAILEKSNTGDILAYLDAVDYDYSEKQFPKDEQVGFDAAQIECIMKHNKLADMILRISNEAVRANRRPRFSAIGVNNKSVTSVLYKGFELSETPLTVANYMKYCMEACFCMDIDENLYLPCYNGIVLSRNNPLSSFAAFCYEMDPRGTFAIRIKLREASNELDRCIENNTGTAAEFIRDLRNIRLTVKDSLGPTGYKNFLDLIMKSGTDRTRFIQELLQNADDCTYPKGREPSFTLYLQGNTLVTEYNEAGFTRANIRAITAIGESTKNSLLNGDLRSIGEKGVGFKTVFATASEVKIYSGEYNFSLTADAPTIPKWIKNANRSISGTRMEITLKERSDMPSYKASDILELCLCLRKLRSIDICGHKVLITDTDTQRTVTIDKRPYVFNKYTHTFAITDQKAIAERKNSTREIDPDQQIICYVPDKPMSTEFPLFCGLPTKHRIHIPMAIDAPFELTTSREEIETDCAAWNGIVKEEMYNAIIKVIHARKTADRAGVLRFARFAYRRFGIQGGMYVNDLFDLPYLNQYEYLPRLRSEKILPTFDENVFVSALEKNAYLYPEAAILLLRKTGNYGVIRPASVIDPEVKDVSKEQKERIDAVFNALSCETASPDGVFPLLQEHAEDHIGDETFRNSLYEYLQNTTPEHWEILADMKIIPVYGEKGGRQFVSWDEDRIFVKKDARTSPESYWVLDETALPKAMCEKMLGVNINEMNLEWERSRYNEHLQSVIRNSNVGIVYNYLLAAFQNGELQKNNSIGTLLQYKDLIPLKNQMEEIVDTELFLCDQPEGYFSNPMLQRIIVHPECARFAEFMQCKVLSSIHYEAVSSYREQLTADDIEALQDDYFTNSEEILRGFYRDDKLSDELIELYDLGYLAVGKILDYDAHYEFPEEPVVCRENLRRHVFQIWEDRCGIFSEEVKRSVQKVRLQNGKSMLLDSKEARDDTIQIYTPEDNSKVCFCQMCRRVKPHQLIEVNNIELLPQYYFPQLRLALCLDCSVNFKELRKKQSIREKFIEAILTEQISSEGKIEIPIGREDTVTFTGNHLAEIQELLKRLQ